MMASTTQKITTTMAMESMIVRRLKMEIQILTSTIMTTMESTTLWI